MHKIRPFKANNQDRSSWIFFSPSANVQGFEIALCVGTEKIHFEYKLSKSVCQDCFISDVVQNCFSFSKEKRRKILFYWCSIKFSVNDGRRNQFSFSQNILPIFIFISFQFVLLCQVQYYFQISLKRCAERGKCHWTWKVDEIFLDYPENGEIFDCHLKW